jgi:prophage maintenance system killer protein
MWAQRVADKVPRLNSTAFVLSEKYQGICPYPTISQNLKKLEVRIQCVWEPDVFECCAVYGMRVTTHLIHL